MRSPGAVALGNVDTALPTSGGVNGGVGGGARRWQGDESGGAFCCDRQHPSLTCFDRSALSPAGVFPFVLSRSGRQLFVFEV